MAAKAAGDDTRYWAFISYSHKDAAFGRPLHRKLESYVLPRRLSGAQALPRRLVPIFRDRDELPAAGDLSTEVRAALAQSRSLIVVCSPQAAASQWVHREVALFRELHPGRPILAAIRSGDPAECFPEPLRRAGADGTVIEPLAADFRRDQDGEALGLLKLVAGIAGVGLDALVQRDAQRKFRRVTAVTAAAIAAMLVMGALTGYALQKKQEAVEQHMDAERLVGFMTNDLDEKLDGVGRLDLMATVNETALRYYNSEIGDLSPAAVMQRAHVLHNLGRDDDKAGRHDKAQAKFDEAWHDTAALLAQAPDDPERLFAQAQSEYWVGLHHYKLGYFQETERNFLAYKRYADQLIAIAPANGRYMQELAYAEGDLCSLYLQPKMKDAPRAIRLCEQALAHMEFASRCRPAPNGIEADLSNRHSWLASAYRSERDNPRTLAQLLIQESMLSDLMKKDPFNKEYRSEWIGMQRIRARLDVEAGNPGHASDRLRQASRLIDDMILLDPENADWASRKASIDQELLKLETATKGIH